MSQPELTAASIVPHLKRCGYDAARLEPDYDFGSGRVPVAAFADTPHDTRSACIAVVDAPAESEPVVTAARPLGAPVVFAVHDGKLQWWKQTTSAPVRMETLDGSRVPEFFHRHKGDLAPGNVFRGKTIGRLPGQTQLKFVDVGLLPFVDKADGDRLSHLVEEAFGDIQCSLGRELRNALDAQNAIRATFWLLGAKVLHDKEVDNFKVLNLADIETVFARVGKHYGVPGGVPPRGRGWRDGTTKAAERIGRFGNLRNLSTESLAHVYENTLVTQEVRKANGTHSTPGPLVDYIVWQLWPWIEELPPDRRHVFEPACGESTFLVSMLRMLRQWSDIDDRKTSHEYLKKHLRGIELDPFAIEVARLSLTLADIPCGNTWDLKQGDMFLDRALEDGAAKCGVLLANPPFERFTESERAEYKKAGITLGANTKACEMLRRTIPHLTKGACFGVVVPLGLLHSKEGTSLRRRILDDFELAEIDVFGDNLFEWGHHESAVLMGRRKTGSIPSGRVWFRRVRRPGLVAFRDKYAFSSEELAETSRFAASELADLRLPELGSVWGYLSAYPKLGEIVKAGQGLQHKGKTLPRGCWTVHDPALQGDPRGFANVNDDLDIFGIPRVVGINLDPKAVRRLGAGRGPGKPQVLVNYAPVSSEAWRLKATLDEEGHPLTSRFIAICPMEREVNALYLWAILNSPVANAFAYTHLGKRDNLVGTMRQMPIPRWSPDNAARIEQAALRYRAIAARTGPGPLYEPEATPEGIRQALLQMDAAVLQAYNLPPRLERQLLDFFEGVERKGVGCEFTGYYPAGFTSSLPLHFVISDRFQRAAADVTADRLHPGESDYVCKVLAEAVGNNDRFYSRGRPRRSRAQTATDCADKE
jgi:hypothetical protein